MIRHEAEVSSIDTGRYAVDNRFIGTKGDHGRGVGSVPSHPWQRL
jgi:hypothetical protein